MRVLCARASVLYIGHCICCVQVHAQISALDACTAVSVGVVDVVMEGDVKI